MRSFGFHCPRRLPTTRRRAIVSVLTALFLAGATPGISRAGQSGSDSREDSLRIRSGDARSVSSVEMNRLPARSVDGVLRLFPGIIHDARSGIVHLRGGNGADAVYLVDGITQQDASTGQPITTLGFGGLESIRLETGVLDAAIGQVATGLVSVQTQTGGRRLHGSVEGLTDAGEGSGPSYNLYSFSLNGPLLPRDDRLTFSGTYEHGGTGDPETTNGDLGTAVGNRFIQENGRARVRWRASQSVELGGGILGSRQRGRDYNHAYYFNTAHMPRYSWDASTYWGEITQSLGPRFRWTARVDRQVSEFIHGDGVHFDDVLGYARPNVNPGTDATYLFWRWDDSGLDPDSLAIGVLWPLATPIERGVDTLVMLDGTEREVTYIAAGDEGHVYYKFLRRETSSTGLSVDFFGRLDNRHELSAGGAYRRYTLRRYESTRATSVLSFDVPGFHDLGFRWVNRYGYDELAEREIDDGPMDAKHPIEMAAWVQDRLTLEDLSVLAGLRIDRIDYKTDRLKDPHIVETSPEADRDNLLERTPGFTRLSPRVGAGLKVGKATSVHLSYGVYHRRQPWDLVQTDYRYFFFQRLVGDRTEIHPNAAMGPVRTIRKEAGITREFGGFVTFGATGFDAEISHLATPFFTPSNSGGYSTLTDEMTVDSRGLILDLTLGGLRGVSLAANYTYQHVKTSYPTYVIPNIVWQGQQITWRVRALAYYDQPSVFNANLDLRAGAGDGPVIAGIRPFEHVGVNVMVRAASGFPYTPTAIHSETFLVPMTPDPIGPVNSKRVGSTYRVDLKVNREIPIGSGALDLFVWVVTVFDRTNVIDVYSSSGLPNTTGWGETTEGLAWQQQHANPGDASGLTGSEKLLLRENDPLHYDTARQWRFGARLLF